MYIVKERKYISINGDYSWRVKIRLGKIEYVEYFCFSKHGGMNKALKVAIIWRNAFLNMNDMLDSLNYRKSPDLFSSRRKPIIGIFKSHNNDNYNWTARWAADGVEHKKHFSISKYGNKSAFLKACEIRYKHSGKLRIVSRKLIPCLPKVPYIIL